MASDMDESRLKPEQLVLLLDSCQQSIKHHSARLDAALNAGDHFTVRTSTTFLKEYSEAFARLTAQLETSLILGSRQSRPSSNISPMNAAPPA